jgi:hypothetical protein
MTRNGQLTTADSVPADLRATYDSDTDGEPSDVWSVIRPASPLWLAPAQATDLWNVKTWEFDFSFTAPAEYPTELNGSWSETLESGTSTRVLDGDRDVENLPGWQRAFDALIARQYPIEDPEPWEPEFYSVGGLMSFSWIRQVPANEDDYGFGYIHQLLVQCYVFGAYPAYYTRHGAPPANYEEFKDNPSIFIPCWVIDVRMYGFSFFGYDTTRPDGGSGFPVGVNSSRGKFEGDLTGPKNSPNLEHGERDDAAWDLSLSIGERFTEG